MDKLAAGVTELHNCQYALEKYENFATYSEDKAWYEDQTLIIGGVVVSFALGSILTYAIMRHK